jgi:peptidoglycan/LPS O-acetylase OafA/YrhL
MTSAASDVASLPREAGLDRLRAAAALAVLVAHGGYFLFPLLPYFDAYALASWLGTEVFFALSGFLVLRSLAPLLAADRTLPQAPARDLRQALGFTAHRLWRILPLYWIFLGLNCALAALDGRGWPDSLAAYAVLAQNFATPHPAFFGEAWNLPLLVLASLALPGLALVARARPDPLRWLSAVLVALVLLGIALRAVWVIEYQPTWDDGVRKLVLTRVDACLYGAIAALIVMRRGVPARRGSAIVALLGLGIGAALFLWLPRDASLNARICAFFAAGVGSAALVLACLDARAPAARAGAALSRWSYALYLVNMPMIFLMVWLGLGQASDALTALLRFAIWIAASLLLSAAVYHAIERPLRARSPWRGPLHRAAGAGPIR